MCTHRSSRVAGGAQHDILSSTGGVTNAANQKQKPSEGSQIILEGGDKVIIHTRTHTHTHTYIYIYIR